MNYNQKFKETKLKYHPYVQKVRDDIAKMYWSMRRQGFKEMAALEFRRAKACQAALQELICGSIINGNENNTRTASGFRK